MDAGFRIFQRDAAESEDGNLRAACLAQDVEASRVNTRDGLFFENRTEDAEISAVRCGVGNFAPSVTGDANSHAGGGARATLSPNLAYGCWRNVVGAQMYAVCITRQGNVRARVY